MNLTKNLKTNKANQTAFKISQYQLHKKSMTLVKKMNLMFH